MDIDKKNNIDTYFHDNLFDVEMEVPAGIFEKIDKQIVEKNRRRTIGYFYAIAASVALLIALGTGYFVGKNSVTMNTSLSSNNINTATNVESEIKTTDGVKTYTEKKKIIIAEKQSAINKSYSLENESNNDIAVEVENRITENNSNQTSTPNKELNSSPSVFLRIKTTFHIALANKPSAMIKKEKLEQKENAIYAEKQLNQSITAEFRSVTWKKKVKIEKGSPFSHTTDLAYNKTIGSSYANDHPVLVANNRDFVSTGANLVSYFGSESKSITSSANDNYKLQPNGTLEGSTSLFNEKENVKVSYMEIPVTGKYQFVNQTVKLSVSGGVSALVPYSLNNNTIGTPIEGKSPTTNNRNYNGIVGMSLQIPLLRNLNFNMEPLFQYPLSTDANKAGTFRFYSGFNYSF